MWVLTVFALRKKKTYRRRSVSAQSTWKKSPVC